MGCIGSTLIAAKHRLSAKKAKRQFQIPDIVIEEYISRSPTDRINLHESEDYIWLTNNSTQLSPKWFVHNCSNVEADYLLRDKPDGTFLVRESSRFEGQYVLAVSLHYFIHQMLIQKTDEGFGLIDPGVHPTIDSLITHYSQVSLKSKNSHLDTKLFKGIFE